MSSRPKALASIGLACLWLAVWAGSAAATPVYVAPKVDAAPQVDGKGWEGAPGVVFSADDPVVKGLGQIWGDIDPNLIWRVAWDDQRLYLLASVKTRELTVGYGGDQIYRNDAIALFLWDEKTGVNYKLFATPTGVGGKGDPLAGWAGMNEPPSKPPAGARVTSAVQADGYAIELSVPWSDIAGGLRPKAGQRLAFTLLVMDANGSAWGQAMWVGHGDTPGQFATLELGA